MPPTVRRFMSVPSRPMSGRWPFMDGLWARVEGDGGALSLPPLGVTSLVLYACWPKGDDCLYGADCPYGSDCIGGGPRGGGGTPGGNKGILSGYGAVVDPYLNGGCCGFVVAV